MPSQTITALGATVITLAGKSNFVITQLVSAGGNGDTTPATLFAGQGFGGGGGGHITSVPIPGADLVGKTHLIVTLGAPGSSSKVILATDAEGGGGQGLTLSPGENGASCSGSGDQAEGGKVISDDSRWINGVDQEIDFAVVPYFGPGAPAIVDNDKGGGGSSGGANGVAGNSNVDGVGGIAPTGGAAGGNKGAPDGNGQVGANYGGGGGGGGTGTTLGGAGGAPKAVITYDLVVAPTITSNGGGATAEITVAAGATAVTTITTTGDAPILIGFDEDDGDHLFFSMVDNEDGTAAVTLLSPAVGGSVYHIVFAAENDGGTDTQEVTVTVLAAATDSINSLYPAWPGLYSD